jgi:excisionase family DNA binding protein
MQSIERAESGETAQPHQAGQPPQSTPDLPRFMPVKEAAKTLGFSVEKIYRACRDGLIPGFKFGRGYRVRRDFVNDFDAATSSGCGDLEAFAAAWMAERNEGAA